MRTALSAHALVRKVRESSPSDLALALVAVGAVGLGLTMSSGWHPHVGRLSQGDLHASLTVMGGALLFGAGLLHMSMWRLGEDAARAYAGAGLLVLGLLTTLTSGTGRLLHADGAAAALNPVTLAWIALASLGLVCAALTSGRRGQRPQVVQPSTIAAALVVVTLVGLSVIGEAHRLTGIEVALSPALHVRIELLVALAWLATAVVARRRTRQGHVVPAVSPGVLAVLALLWALRAAAVTDLAAWGVASAALLAATAVVVLSTATSDFVDATEAEHTRADEAEQAVVSAAFELQQHDADTRTLNHDARNMLLALRTASQTLADYGERLAPDDRHELERAILAEAVKLDELIAGRARVARERHPASRPVPTAVFIPTQRDSVALEVVR